MAEITSTPESDFDYQFPLTVSSGDALSGESDSELSLDTPVDSGDTGTDSPSAVYTGSPENEAELLTLLQEVKETQAQVLVSTQRLELQFEACISILLIFLVVGLLNYIYKFFKMFF